MPKILFISICLLSFIFAFSAAASAKVVLLSIDGMTQKDFQVIKQNGGFSQKTDASVFKDFELHSVVGEPTVTYPVHASIITGLSYLDHGVLSNVDKQAQYVAQFAQMNQAFKQHSLWQHVHLKNKRFMGLRWPTTEGMGDFNGPHLIIPEKYNFSLSFNPVSKKLSVKPESKESFAVELLKASLIPEKFQEKLSAAYFAKNDWNLFDSLPLDAEMAKVFTENYQQFDFIAGHLVSIDAGYHARNKADPEGFSRQENIQSLLRLLREKGKSDCIMIFGDHGIIDVEDELESTGLGAGTQIKYDPHIYSELPLAQKHEKLTCEAQDFVDFAQNHYAYKCEPEAGTLLVAAKDLGKKKGKVGYHGPSFQAIDPDDLSQAALYQKFENLKTRLLISNACQYSLKNVYHFQDIYQIALDNL